MTESLTPEEMIRANAEMVLAVARDDFGQDIGFDRPGVQWLDGYIQALVDQGNVEASEELCDQLGSFLGTCIIETYGGSWQDTEYGWAVVIKDDFAVFPFNKTLKHLTEGEGDSVLALFTGIPAMLGYAEQGPGAEQPEAEAEPIVTAPAAVEPPAPAQPAETKPGSVMNKLGSLFRRR